MHDLGGVLSWEPPETLRWVTSTSFESGHLDAENR